MTLKGPACEQAAGKGSGQQQQLVKKPCGGCEESGNNPECKLAGGERENVVGDEAGGQEEPSGPGEDRPWEHFKERRDWIQEH